MIDKNQYFKAKNLKEQIANLNPFVQEFHDFLSFQYGTRVGLCKNIPEIQNKVRETGFQTYLKSKDDNLILLVSSIFNFCGQVPETSLLELFDPEYPMRVFTL